MARPANYLARERAAAALAADPGAVSRAAKAAGVDRTTVQRWNKQAAFHKLVEAKRRVKAAESKARTEELHRKLKDAEGVMKNSAGIVSEEEARHRTLGMLLDAIEDSEVAMKDRIAAAKIVMTCIKVGSTLTDIKAGDLTVLPKPDPAEAAKRLSL